MCIWTHDSTKRIPEVTSVVIFSKVRSVVTLHCTFSIELTFWNFYFGEQVRCWRCARDVNKVIAVCCSVLQCVAVCCSVLRYIVLCCSVM